MRRWLRSLVRRSRLDREIAEELQFHIDARAADLAAAGVPRERARRQARLEFGALESYKDQARDAAGLRLLSDLAADIRYATRLMRRRPMFAAVAIVSLALGIGANTLAFSVVNALVLRPLAVARPGELAFVQTPNRPSLSFPAYRDIRDRNDVFAGVIGFRIAPMNVEHEGAATRVWGYLATGNYFDVLGVQPEAGVFFHQAQDQPPAPSLVAVLSHDYWVTHFAANPAIVGAELRINGASYLVLGVAPRGFVGTELFYRPDLWVPMTMQPQIEARASWLNDRRTANTWVLARLKPALSPRQAQAGLAALAASIVREHPLTDDGLSLTLSEPGLVGNALGTAVRAFTLGVLALAGLVLLMACVNLAVVLTARGAERQRELAIRLSIGAGTGRLVRQLLTETLVIAVAGGLSGLLLAVTAARALSAWRFPVTLPVQFDVSADPAVFLFALTISLAAGLLFGLAPARQAARTDANATLKGTSPKVLIGGRRWTVRDLLVSGQVAICVVLMTGSVLAILGMQASLTVPLGFEPHGVAMVGVDVGLAGYDQPHGRDFARRVVEAIQQLPGVDSAAVSDTLPLNVDQSSTTVFPEDQPGLAMSQARSASRFRVSPGFFLTLGVRVRRGRAIEAIDEAETPTVAVINETFARSILHVADPIGRRFRYGMSGGWIEVVGMVEDGKYRTLNEPAQPAVFEALAQHYSSTMIVTARSSRPAGEFVPAMRSAISALDPALALHEAESLDDMLAFVRFPNRAAAMALGVFGVLALLLAVTGLHGVVAQAVEKRRKEIGIRIAVGARPAEVLRVVLMRTVVLLVAGAAAGGVLVTLAGGVLASVVYGVSLRDPVVLAGVALGLILTGVMSCWIPARRALRVNPVNALRSE